MQIKQTVMHQHVTTSMSLVNAVNAILTHRPPSMPSRDIYFDDLTQCSLLGFLRRKRPTDKTKAHSLYKGTLSAIAADVHEKPERKAAALACLKTFKESFL